MKQFIEAGEFVTTHGILGELKLYPWCDSPDFLCGLKALFLDENGKKTIDIEKIRPQKTVCLVKIKEINTVEQARQFIGKTVYLNRNDVKLKKGTHFVQDLLGCKIIDADTNKLYGVISDISAPGAHNVYTVKNNKGEEFLFPAVDEFIHLSAPEKGEIYVKPIDGMFNTKGEAIDEN